MQEQCRSLQNMNTILLISSHQLLFTHVANRNFPSARKIRQLKGLEREKQKDGKSTSHCFRFAPIHTLEIYQVNLNQSPSIQNLKYILTRNWCCYISHNDVNNDDKNTEGVFWWCHISYNDTFNHIVMLTFNHLKTVLWWQKYRKYIMIMPPYFTWLN